MIGQPHTPSSPDRPICLGHSSLNAEYLKGSETRLSTFNFSDVDTTSFHTFVRITNCRTKQCCRCELCKLTISANLVTLAAFFLNFDNFRKP